MKVAVLVPVLALGPVLVLAEDSDCCCNIPQRTAPPVLRETHGTLRGLLYGQFLQGCYPPNLPYLGPSFVQLSQSRI